MSGIICKECGRYGPFSTDWCTDCMYRAYGVADKPMHVRGIVPPSNEDIDQTIERLFPRDKDPEDA